MRFIAAMLLIALLAGCKKAPDEQPLPLRSETPPPYAAGMTVGAITVERDDDVLVSVNSAKLTRAQARSQADGYIARNGAQIPPEQVQEVRKRIVDAAIEQFVGQTLIVSEIDRQNPQVTQEDEAAMYKEVAESLPAGTTLDDVIKKNPGIEKQIREQVQMMIKADKILGDRVKFSEQELSDFMIKNSERLTLPENVHTRHILIATSDTDDEQTKAEKKKKAEEVRKNLLDGADFAELATKFSDCPSKQQGGDLGVFPKEGPGAPVPAFADAAFSQQTNAIGPVIETQFGYHIIQVLEHNNGGLVSREQVAREMKKDKREKAMSELLTELKSKADIKYLEPKMDNEQNKPGTPVP